MFLIKGLSVNNIGLHFQDFTLICLPPLEKSIYRSLENA
jgi:hypothetical protein